MVRVPELLTHFVEGDMRSAVRQVLPVSNYSDARIVDEALATLASIHGPDVYALLLKELFHVIFPSLEAREHWKRIVEHHEDFRMKLGTSVDFRVSALDYFTRVIGLILNPTVMEAGQYEKLLNAAVTDELTRLFNRRHFEGVLAREVERAARYQSQLSLLFFDVDHFKTLNDRLGHPVGDRTLRLVADVIAASIRSIDSAFRYGGEEFAVVAPEAGKEGALIIAERIRRGVADLKLPEAKDLISNITLSGGIACFPEDALTAEDLLSTADGALYRAKGNGRNRIEVHAGERRGSRRHPMELTTVCSVLPQVKQIATTRNLSAGGFQVEAAEPLPRGSTIEFEMSLSRSQEPLFCIGRVKYVERVKGEETYRFGVSIVRMSREDTGRYRALLTLKRAA